MQKRTSFREIYINSLQEKWFFMTIKTIKKNRLIVIENIMWHKKFFVMVYFATYFLWQIEVVRYIQH